VVRNDTKGYNAYKAMMRKYEQYKRLRERMWEYLNGTM